MIRKPNKSEEAQEYASVLANSKYYRHAAPEELNGCGETLHATTVWFLDIIFFENFSKNFAKFCEFKNLDERYVLGCLGKAFKCGYWVMVEREK